jgi:hypothetical protein
MKGENTIDIDFGGTICAHGDIAGKPLADDTFAKLESYLDAGILVVIHTALAAKPENVEEIIQWFEDNGFDRVDELIITAVKPHAHMVVDDLAYRSEDGNLPTVEEFRAFRPWWDKSRDDKADDEAKNQVIERLNNLTQNLWGDK